MSRDASFDDGGEEIELADEHELGDVAADQRALIAADIVSGVAFKDIAQKHGIHRTTLRRWRQEPEMIGLVAQIRGEVLAEIMGGLVSSATASIETLEAIRDDVEVRDTDRVRAAAILLGEWRSAHSTLELESRLAGLEHAAAQLSDNKKALEQ